MRYKALPSARRYSVGEDGVIMDRKTKVIVKPFLTVKGDPFVKVMNDDGVIVTIQVSFLVARLYLSSNQGYKELYHIDGDRQNNHYKNLGWRDRISTFSMQYWWLLNNEKTPLRVRDIKTKTIQYFPSITNAARCLNLKISSIKYALEEQSIYCNYQFKHLSDFSLFDISNDLTITDEEKKRRPVVFQVYYIPTKEVVLYQNYQEFKRQTGLSEFTIKRFIDDDIETVLPGYIHVQRGSQEVSWPDIKDYKSKVTPLKGALMVCRIDLKSKEEQYYINAKHASITNGIPYKDMTRLLKTKTGIYDTYKFIYISN